MLTFKGSHGPHGKLLTCACLDSLLPSRFALVCRTVVADLYVPTTPAKLHRPNGRFADALASTLASQLQYVRAAETFNYTIDPMGKLLTCFCPESCLHNCERSGQLKNVRAAETLKVPIAPVGDSHYAHNLQGGGVFVNGGSVTIDLCTIRGNTATVRAHVQKFPSPRWENS